MNDTELRAVYERIMARRGSGAASGASPEDIVAVVEQRGSDEARAAILNSLLSTADGRAELELVRAAVTAASPPAARRYYVPLSIAAGILIAVVGTATLMRGRQETDQLRGGAAGVVLVSPAANAAAGLRPVFVWRRVTDASSYTVEVLDEGGDLVSRHVVSDTTLALPDASSLVAGRTYSWRVSARAEASSVSSETRSFKAGER